MFKNNLIYVSKHLFRYYIYILRGCEDIEILEKLIYFLLYQIIIYLIFYYILKFQILKLNKNIQITYFKSVYYFNKGRS